MDRRTFLHLTGTTALVTLAAPALVGCAGADRPAWTKGDPFALGVAAGDPTPDGFVLWTRLAPDPLPPIPRRPGA